MMLERLEERAERTPDAVALRQKALGVWRVTTWSGYREAVRRAALGLQALGVAAGDRVAILAAARIEWPIAELAVRAVGAVSVGLAPDGPPEEAAAILAETGPRALIADEPARLERVLTGGAPRPEHVVLLDGSAAGCLAWAEVLAPSAVTPWLTRPGPDEVVTLALTAGAAAPPRPVPLTAADVEAAAEAVAADHGAPPPGPGDEVLAALPPALAEERAATTWLGLARGCTVSFPESPATADDDLRELQPTLVAWPARRWAYVRAEVLAGLEGPSRPARAALRSGLRLAGAGGWRRALSAPVVAPLRRHLGLSLCRSALALGDAPDPGSARLLADLGIAVRPTRPLPALAEVDERPEALALAEARLADAPVVRGAVVLGECAERLGALVAVEAELASAWARRRGIATGGHRDLVARPEVTVLIDVAVREANAALAGRAVIVCARPLPEPLSGTRGDVAPNGALRRWDLARRHAGLAAALEVGAP
jgi:long-subunit acyl-CoA synthetase (AMP-forming)